MKALYLIEPGKTEIREIDRPVPKDDEVLLKVGRVGFCGGDLNGFRGLFELQEYPVVLGHEVGDGISLSELRDLHVLQKGTPQCLSG